MDIYNTRRLLKECSIFELNLRVAYYARVSTDKDEQKTSIMHQQDYYDEFITDTPNWTFVGKYIDEGISGVTASKRVAFQQMIKDAREGKIDLIITKEISRFARNVLDSIQYTRELLSSGTAVWFQNDNINTLDEDSELRLTIMSGIAQDESRRISNRVRFGHARSIQNGVVMGNSRIYGYDKRNGKLYINEKEAEMIRLVFQKYATGRWSTKTLSKYLWECGYRNYNGNKIDATVIGHIIANPKYKGYYVGGKVKIVDLFTKKQKFLPENEWTYYKDDGDTVPAIVDEKIWEAANEILKKRGSDVKKNRTSYKNNLFTGMLKCANDGSTYWLKNHAVNGRRDETWVCSHRIKNGVESCNSFSVRQSDILEILANIFNECIFNPDVVAKEYASFYEKEVFNISEKEKEEKALLMEINELELKRDKLLDFSLAGSISDEEFILRNSSFSDQIKQKKLRLAKLHTVPVSKKELQDSIEQIMRQAKEYAHINKKDITRQLLENTISSIEIKPTGEKKAEVSIFLLNGHSYANNEEHRRFMIEEHNADYHEYVFRGDTFYKITVGIQS